MNGISKLSEIITDIKEFESQLWESNGNSSTKPKLSLIDETMNRFATKVVLNVLNVVDIRAIYFSVKEGISTALTCLACHSLITLMFSKWFSADTLAFAFTQICSILNLTEHDVCEGYINLFKDQVDFIRHNTILDTPEICGLLMGDQCYSGQSEHLHWTLTLPQKSNQTIKRKRKSKRNKIYKILQITDIHLDLDYIPYTSGTCRTPYCCRQSKKAIAVNMSANYWGSYPCDTPIQTMDSMFRHIDWQSIDWTYWTGDITAHDSWMDSRTNSLRTANVINNYFRTFSPNKKVLPTIGNHVAVPVGSFPPPLLQNPFDISWLFDQLSEQWSQWLSKEANESFRYGGYYMLQLTPGLRVIVLNTNYCARLNIWTLYRSIDPSDQLKWLSFQLGLAEEAGDSVHIVGHIPPDNRECTQSWLYNYMAIIERYSDIIEGQFYGHTHYDEFRVLYSVHNISKPIGLEILSPSVTTYSESNPAYRIIHCTQTGEIVDIETFSFDLTEANSGYKSTPNWFSEYSMAEIYSLKHFNAITFDQLIRNIDSDDTYLQTFYAYSHRKSTFANNYCNNDCKHEIIANTLIANPFQQKMKPLLDVVVNNRIFYENIFTNHSLH